MDKYSYASRIYRELVGDYGIDAPPLLFDDYRLSMFDEVFGVPKPYAWTHFPTLEPGDFRPAECVALQHTYVDYMTYLEIEYILRHELAHVLAHPNLPNNMEEHGHGQPWKDAAVRMGIIPHVKVTIGYHAEMYADSLSGTAPVINNTLLVRA